MRFPSLLSVLSVAILSTGLLHCSAAADDEDEDDISESESDLTKDGGADAGKKKKRKDGGVSDAGDAGKTSTKKDSGVATKDSGVKAPPTSGAPTWTEIYDTYFADGTPGHCGDCHANKGIAVGTTKTSFYNALVSNQLIDLTTPADSVLGLSPGSPLSWFGGSMPKDDASPNPAAAKAITAWLNDGAKNN